MAVITNLIFICGEKMMTATETAAKAAYNSPRKRNIQEEMKKGGKKKEVFLSLADFSKVVPPREGVRNFKLV